MTTFEDRERAFEEKFARDEEMRFRAEVRRNKLMGLWAAELLGRRGEDAEAYARDLVKLELDPEGERKLAERLASDLDGLAGAGEIATQMEALMRTAKDQLMNES